MKGALALVVDDITTMRVDAIVSASNPSLISFSGVSGAVHRAAGPKLLDACVEHRGCQPGAAAITPGFNLPAPHIIHAVGPVWQGGDHGEEEVLRNCYARVLEIARVYEIRSIAFSAISCGAYGFPVDKAANIAVGTVHYFMEQNDYPSTVFFVCYEPRVTRAYRRVVNAVNGKVT